MSLDNILVILDMLSFNISTFSLFVVFRIVIHMLLSICATFSYTMFIVMHQYIKKKFFGDENLLGNKPNSDSNISLIW